MVRKRTRKYESEDEPDSDSDIDLESPPGSPAPKKYSLRQRKRPMFIEDFDYDEDGDAIPPKAPSDDDEYQVEEDLEEARSAQEKKSYVRRGPRGPRTPRRRRSEQTEQSSVDIIESELLLPEDVPDDPSAVDFEDMIRADVVMNRNRIDYDNIINKTEIKVQPLDNDESMVVRRGRPRRKPNVEPILDEDVENKDGNSESNDFVVAIDPNMMLEGDKEDSDKNSLDLHNGVSNSSDDQPLKTLICAAKQEVITNNHVEEIEDESSNSVEIQEKEGKTPTTNNEKLKFPDPSSITDEELLNNCHIEKEVKFEVHSKEDTYDIFEDPKFDEDCDDIIFIEPQQEIIVLDDD